jgi:DNA-binding NtrC family response regulator
VIRPPDTKPRAGIRLRSPSVTGGGPLILVVEDDPSLRLLCRVNLELDGYRVEEAATLDAAREAVAAARPALIFLDAHLGTEECDALLDELVGAGVPVVLVSGIGDLDRYRDRATEVLGKPFAPQALADAASRLVAGNVSAP